MVHNTSFWVHTRFNLLYSLATSLHKLATTLDKTYQMRWYVFVANGMIFARSYY